LGKSIEEEKNLPFNIDDAIKAIKEKEKEGKNEIKELKTNYHIFLDEEEENLRLKGKYTKDGKIELEDGTAPSIIKDEGFEKISKIVFKNLIEINLSCNGITTAKYLNKMNLPHLEILDLSDNQINDAKPIANLKSRYLKMIFLQENIIETLKDFNDKKVKFKELEILRVDKNKLDLNDIEFKKAKKKFGRKLIYETISPESFGKKYEVNLKEGETKLDLSGKKRKELLIDLINIIGQLLSLNSLYLDNNNIDNPTILGNIPLYNLKILDLSLNKITNIFFLRKLSKKCGDLEELYLNDNKIADITPFQSFPEKKYEISFSKLKILTLKNNLFYDRRTNRCCRCFGCCSFWNSCYCDNCRDYCRNKKKKTRSNKTIISIKDIKTREVFKSIIKRFRTDFGDSENIIIKEERKEIEANIENDLISNEVNTDTNSNINANNNGN
jgi:Leucine-rich repeat (LRR) protein